MTQRLLVQSEEVSRHSEIAWPRFHDLLRIYHIQNMAIAGSRNASSPNDAADPGASISRSLNTCQQPRPPLGSSGSLTNFFDISEPNHAKDWELRVKNSPLNLNLFEHTPAGSVLPTESPTSHTVLPSVLPPLSSSVQGQQLSLPCIKTIPLISQEEVIRIPTSENRTPQLLLIRPRHSELGKRPHSSFDAVTVLKRSLPSRVADVEGGKRARIY